MENKVLNIDKSSWKLTKLGELLYDISTRVDNPGQSGYERFIGLEHFVSGDIRIKAWGTTKNLTSSAKAFKAGDILFARRNAYLRRASLVDFDGCCSGDAFVLRENHDKVVPGFMAFFMNSNAVWDFANENAAGTMSQRVKWRDLANYEFLLPPKDQQAQLAELLWALDEVVETRKILNEELMKLVNSEIYHFFKGHVVEKILLGDVADIKYGITLNSNRQGMNIKVPYLRVANVKRGTIDLQEVKEIGCSLDEIELYKLKAGDLLVVEGHADVNEIGRAALWMNTQDTVLHQNHLIRVRNCTKLKPLVLDAYFNSIFGRSYFSSNSKSTTGLNTINSSVVKNFRIPKIDYHDQNIFETRKSAIDKQIVITEKALCHSLALQKSLINQIF